MSVYYVTSIQAREIRIIHNYREAKQMTLEIQERDPARQGLSRALSTLGRRIMQRAAPAGSSCLTLSGSVLWQRQEVSVGIPQRQVLWTGCSGAGAATLPSAAGGQGRAISHPWGLLGITQHTLRWLEKSAHAPHGP